MKNICITIMAIILTVIIGIFYGFCFGLGISWMVWADGLNMLFMYGLSMTLCACQCCTNFIERYVNLFKTINSL